MLDEEYSRLSVKYILISIAGNRKTQEGRVSLVGSWVGLETEESRVGVRKKESVLEELKKTVGCIDTILVLWVFLDINNSELRV
jgi:hypothetical protein